MALSQKIAGVFIAAVVVAMIAGCGSGSDANDAEASKTFLVKGGENKIPKFGEEADAEEREAASIVLEENLEAREAGDWAAQCSSLASGGVNEVEAVATVKAAEGGGCEEELKAVSEPLSETKPFRENTMTGPIDALRVKDDQAWALYHGAKGKDYAMKMEKEDDEWKVGALTTAEIE